ncbi:MAG: mechanosensitive ion channel domain-containing protein [Myxococcota bacterium]
MSRPGGIFLTALLVAGPFDASGQSPVVTTTAADVALIAPAAAADAGLISGLRSPPPAFAADGGLTLDPGSLPPPAVIDESVTIDAGLSPRRSPRRRRRSRRLSTVSKRPPADAGVRRAVDAGLPSGSIVSPSTIEAPPRKAVDKRPTPPSAPIGAVEQLWKDLGASVSIFVPSEQLQAMTEPFLLGLLLAISLLVAGVSARGRVLLAPTGLLPSLLEFIQLAARFVALALAIIFIIRAAPDWLQPALPWVLLAAAVAVGWSLRDFLPDLLAGAVLLAERKVRRGVWVSVDSVSGTVERLGVRATWLKNNLGRSLVVPNRRMLQKTVQLADPAESSHRVSVRLPTKDGRARAAIVKAVVTSPWVPLGTTPEVYQDSEDASLWHVEVRLRSFAEARRFDGELRARISSMIDP